MNEDKELEKEIERYFESWNFDEELDIMVKPDNYSASFDDIKEIARYFANWGKEQMIKYSIPGSIYRDLRNGSTKVYIETDPFEETEELKKGTEVKVIAIIK